MAGWEQILLGIGAVALLFLFWPGVKRAMQQSKEAENPDWSEALLPVVVVIGFVILLIMLARG